MYSFRCYMIVYERERGSRHVTSMYMDVLEKQVEKFNDHQTLFSSAIIGFSVIIKVEER